MTDREQKLVRKPAKKAAARPGPRVVAALGARLSIARTAAS